MAASSREYCINDSAIASPAVRATPITAQRSRGPTRSKAIAMIPPASPKLAERESASRKHQTRGSERAPQRHLRRLRSL